MKVKYQDSLKYKLICRIDEIPGNVILRSDFIDLGGYRQIGCALKSLIDDGVIAKIAFGVYVKTFKSEYTGNYILKGGFADVAIEALNRLGVKWTLTRAQKDYNEGKTTQVPVRPNIRLKSRCRRVFRYGNAILGYEDGAYAR
jgi:hypothetical protein